jgi:EAL domain-containing protein (putative c-di-GMP-specific phosphodiesterase class I)
MDPSGAGGAAGKPDWLAEPAEARVAVVRDRVAAATAVRRALEEDEFSLVYQMRVDLHSGDVIGMEALARWTSARYGAVPPDRFIPLAEEVDVIGELGRWVLRRACNEAVRLEKALRRPLRLSVNVSPWQLRRPGLTQDVTDALSDSGYRPDSLELELTERSSLPRESTVLRTIAELRADGVTMSLDDFGSGCANLSYLTWLPVDVLKIDKVFVQDVPRDTPALPILDAIIELGHRVGATVVAEGVERTEQASYLRSRGCDQAQGLHYGPAVRADEFVAAVSQVATRPPG